MASSRLPVNLWNPAHVLAALGLLEAAESLLGGAKGGFHWQNPQNICFEVSASGADNPLEAILGFLAVAQVAALKPPDFEEAEPDEDESADSDMDSLLPIQTFPAARGNRMALPIRLSAGNKSIELNHWADESRRDNFKLYAGNRTAYSIASAMLGGVRKSPKKNQTVGDILRKGVSQLWSEQREELLQDPFGTVTPLGGSFNFDSRRAWTAIDAGYSPNQQNTPVVASPLVEILAAWGLQYTRPVENSTRNYTYHVWGLPIAPMLARVAFCGGIADLPLRKFQFELAMSGKDKVVNYAEERNQS